MNSFQFLQDLTVVLSAASAVLLLFRRFKQPPVLGYLAAGLLIGPLTPDIKLVSDFHSLEALAQIGVVFLLFALGAEFNLKRLFDVGVRALVAAVVEIGILLGAGYALGLALGLSPIGALLLGGVISLASTAIVARLVLEQGRAAEGWGELATGVLVAEDIFAVILIAFFTSAGRVDALDVGVLFSQLARFGMLVTLVLVAGLLVLPWIMGAVERSGMKEVRTLVIIGTCFGVSFLTEMLGFSAALGAFLAGAMMAETGPATKLRETVEPFKDVFGAVFFTAVGMLVDPTWVLVNWKISFGMLAVVCVGRFAANFAAFTLVGEEKGAIVKSSVARMPIGEFSFILAQVGDSHNLTSWPLYPISVLLCLGTTGLSASFLPGAVGSARFAERIVPEWLDHFLGEYRAGVRRISVPKRMQILIKLIKPSLAQIFLNLLGISGLFLSAIWVQERYQAPPGVMWVAACFVSLPFLYALWRKAQAVTLILLEDITTRGADPRPPLETHPRTTRLILAAATVLVAWWYLSLSWTLLPSWPYTLFPIAGMLVAGAFLWRKMNMFYAGIQVSLRTTLAKGPAGAEASATLISHLVEAKSSAKIHIYTLTLDDRSPCAGRSIKELGLRSLTGASILQINRNGESNTTPGSKTHLQGGDEIVLVGERAQIAQAKTLLEDGPGQPD